MSKIFVQESTLPRVLPYLLIIAGVIGLFASFVLTYDKLQVMQNPAYSPPCNINPILSCGSVMKTEQASLMGVPNSIFGIIAFSMLALFGVVLAGGAVLKKWVWLGAQIAALFGVVFMHYLFFQGVFRIKAICPWCFMVWMITIPVFWYITLYNLKEGIIRLPEKWAKFNLFLQKHHGDILFIWYAIIFSILLQRFWYYWSTLIS